MDKRTGPYQPVTGDDLLAARLKIGKKEASLTFPWGEQYFFGLDDGKHSGHGQPMDAYDKKEV